MKDYGTPTIEEKEEAARLYPSNVGVIGDEVAMIADFQEIWMHIEQLEKKVKELESQLQYKKNIEHKAEYYGGFL